MSQIPIFKGTNVITHLFYLTILVLGSQYDFYSVYIPFGLRVHTPSYSQITMI